MSVNNPESSYSSAELEQRASNILDGVCVKCPLAKRLVGHSILDDGVMYGGASAVNRFGGFMGGAMQIIKADACEGQNCITPDQLETVKTAISLDTLPFDEAAAERFTRMAVDRGLLPLRDLEDFNYE